MKEIFLEKCVATASVPARFWEQSCVTENDGDGWIATKIGNHISIQRITCGTLEKQSLYFIRFWWDILCGRVICDGINLGFFRRPWTAMIASSFATRYLSERKTVSLSSKVTVDSIFFKRTAFFFQKERICVFPVRTCAHWVVYWLLYLRTLVPLLPV